VTAAFGMRLAGLAAAALLAGVLAVALAEASRGDDARQQTRPAAGPWGGWTAAQVGIAAGAPAGGREGDCGWVIASRTQGVIHPVLPCGAKVFVEYRAREALTRVVAQSPVGDGRQFDLTPRLAKALGLDGIRTVRWAFSR
jgi:hypothetical protein